MRTTDTESHPSPPVEVSLDAIRQAVTQSGYPLQMRVAEMLRRSFTLQPEWGFADPNTGQLRAIDVMAIRDYYDTREPNAHLVRPRLVLLIECKQSTTPFIFFDDDGELPGWTNYPLIAGLRQDRMFLSFNDNRRILVLSNHQALQVSRHAFVVEPQSCLTLSKARRKGKGLELSGTEAYQGVVMPIRSAMAFYMARKGPHPEKTAKEYSLTLETPPSHRWGHRDMDVVIGLAVLDAPMVAVTLKGLSEPDLHYVKWRRLWRNEPSEELFASNQTAMFGVDFVHIDFLESYLRDHVSPYMNTISERATRHHIELASCKGYIPGKGENFSYSETLLQPRVSPIS